MRVTRRADKSTVYRLWSIMGQPELYPNMCQRCLVGTLSAAAGQHVKFMYRSGMLLPWDTASTSCGRLPRLATPACIYLLPVMLLYCTSTLPLYSHNPLQDATLPHALLQCSAFSEQQAAKAAFWRSITAVLGEASEATVSCPAQGATYQ
jgi:hypothetical protein